MKKWFSVILCILFLALSGCRADPDLILQNQSSAEEETGTDDSRRENTVEKEPAQEMAEAAQSKICAYICGAVCIPGVYELETDSRVFQLVELAGGMTEDADEKSVNLAEIVADGQMIWIPTREESLNGQGAPQTGASGTGSGISGNGTEAQKINLNTASAEELTELNGIGETKAEAIVAYREEHGAFGKIDDIMQVSGIGQGTFDKIKDHITV